MIRDGWKIDSWLLHLRAVGRSENTIDAYRRDLEAWLSALGELSPAQVRRQTLDSIISGMRASGLGAGTIRRRVAALGAYYDWLAYSGISDHAPTRGLRLPRLPARLPRVPSEADLSRLLSLPADSPQEAQDLLIVDILYSSGARASELAGARPEDLDRGSGSLRITGKGGREAILGLPPATLSRLLGWLQQAPRAPQALICAPDGSPLGRHGIYRSVSRAGLRAGLALHPHALRHAAATHMLARGCDVRIVQAFLRHASISTTMIYTHISQSQLVQAQMRYHPRAVIVPEPKT